MDSVVRTQPGLSAAMLPGNLIGTALVRLPKTEVVSVEGQNLARANRTEHPIGQGDLNPQQAAIQTLLPTNSGSVDKPKRLDLLLITRADVRADGGSSQPL